MNKATTPQMIIQLEMVQAFKEAGILFVPIPALNNKDAKNLTDMMVERVELLSTDSPEEEQTCLTCLYEPEWEETLYGDMGAEHGYCRWKPENRPNGVMCIEMSVILKCEEPTKRCPTWKPKR